MSIKIKDRFDSIGISNRDFSHTLRDPEIQSAWSQTAELYDVGHQGAASLVLGGLIILMEEQEWKYLYEIADKYLDRIFAAHILEDETQELN